MAPPHTAQLGKHTSQHTSPSLPPPSPSPESAWLTTTVAPSAPTVDFPTPPLAAGAGIASGTCATGPLIPLEEARPLGTAPSAAAILPAPLPIAAASAKRCTCGVTSAPFADPDDEDGGGGEGGLGRDVLGLSRAAREWLRVAAASSLMAWAASSPASSMAGRMASMTCRRNEPRDSTGRELQWRTHAALDGSGGFAAEASCSSEGRGQKPWLKMRSWARQRRWRVSERGSAESGAGADRTTCEVRLTGVAGEPD
mmetsp:Transcript_26504/g.99707  ORF Transcript_26504/g.99707 Transcript_26504/m.99707 type:complete len:255 (+) Transcript_26504:430-1194(+)